MRRDQDKTAELDAFIGFAAGLLTALVTALALAGLAELLTVGPGWHQVGYGLIAAAGLTGTVAAYLRLRTRRAP